MAPSLRSHVAAGAPVLLQLGTIHRQMGQVNEAVDSFVQALELDPKNGLALQGAGEAHLAQAHARTSEGLYKAAAGALQKGCELLRSLLAGVSAELAACAPEEEVWHRLGRPSHVKFRPPLPCDHSAKASSLASEKSAGGYRALC